ncbi:hypothetical protein EJB05_37343, partial [Eragrostis curvula]
MVGLSDLDFLPGIHFQDLVVQRFGPSAVVSSSSPDGEFFLVASFSRSAIRINEDSASMILQSCLGGQAKDFRVSLLRDWCFRFSVSCKDIGFMVYRLGSVITKHFALFFALWSNGGPDSIRQKKIWDTIQDEEWHVVCNSKKSYAAVVKSRLQVSKGKASVTEIQSFVQPKRPVQGRVAQALRHRRKQSVFRRIHYPTDYYEKNFADYPAPDRVSRQSSQNPVRNSAVDLHQMGCARNQVQNHAVHADPLEAVRAFPGSSGNFQNSNSSPAIMENNARQLLCFRCLSPNHRVFNCKNQVRCKVCFFYGHISRNCRVKSRPKSQYRVKSVMAQPGPSIPVNPNTTAHVAGLITGGDPCQANSHDPGDTLPSTIPSSSVSPIMANIPVDPRPHAPRGIAVREKDPNRPPLRARAFLGRALERRNEDLAIAVLEPQVAKIDFVPMARELRRFLASEFNLINLEFFQCPIGAAFVRFNSCVRRQSMIDRGVIPFGPYHLSFVKHDEGDNYQAVDVDHEVWLQLLCYPLDARSFPAVARAVCSFATLTHLHESDNPSRVIVRVLVRAEADVPDDITVTAGEGPSMRSWTVPMDILSGHFVQVPADEDELPPEGPLHPIPPQPLRCLGLRDDAYFGESVVDEVAPPPAQIPCFKKRWPPLCFLWRCCRLCGIWWCS